MLQVEQGPPEHLERLGAHYPPAGRLRLLDDGGVIGGWSLDLERGNPGDAQPPGVCPGREQSGQVLPGLKRPIEVFRIEADFLGGSLEHLQVSDVSALCEVSREDSATEFWKSGEVARVFGGQYGQARISAARARNMSCVGRKSAPPNNSPTRRPSSRVSGWIS